MINLLLYVVILAIWVYFILYPLTVLVREGLLKLGSHVLGKRCIHGNCNGKGVHCGYDDCNGHR